MNINDFHLVDSDLFASILENKNIPTLGYDALERMIHDNAWVLQRNKIPYQHNGYMAKPNDPTTWSDFLLAITTRNRGRYDGIGYVLHKDCGVLCIDLDHCIDEFGEFSETAAEFVEALDNVAHVYAEVSQSGHGLHFFVSGVELPVPNGRPNSSYKNTAAGVEFYTDAHYIALTGKQIAYKTVPDDATYDYGPPKASYLVDERYKANVRDLWAKYRPHKDRPRTEARDLSVDFQTGIDSAYVLRKCMSGKHGDTFRQLYYGGYEGLFGSHSEADLFLCGQLAFWTDCNAAQIDNIFRSSALMRDKWLRDDYRERTIGEAISGCRESISEYRARRTQERRNELAADFFK